MNDRPEWIIETQDLTHVYGGVNGVRALDNVSLKIAYGEFVTVMGPSGSGKSTLLNMIGGLDKPTSGQVLVDGMDLRKTRNKDGFRARTVGFVFQLHNLLPTLTARENVEIPMMGYKGARARHKRSAELLELVGLPDRMKHLPSQLSGGERQRVAAARALANDPPLVLADEPTGSLDTTAGNDLMDLLRELNETQGTTFIIVTHDFDVARQTDRVVVMRDGHIARESVIGLPVEEDLKTWRYSELGQHIIDGNMDILKPLGITKRQAQTMARIFKANGEAETKAEEKS